MRQENLAGRSVVWNTERPSGGEEEGDRRGAGGSQVCFSTSEVKALLSQSSDALLLRRSDAEVSQDRAAVLIDRVRRDMAFFGLMWYNVAVQTSVRPTEV